MFAQYEILFKWTLALHENNNKYYAELSPRTGVLAGTETPGSGGRGCLFQTPHCHHQNDSCIQMGTDDSHSHASLVAMGKVTRQCPQTTTFDDKGEPKRGIEPLSSAYQPNALPLGQTGSHPKDDIVSSSFLQGGKRASVLFY